MCIRDRSILLLLFPKTRKAGLASGIAMLFMLSTGNMSLKPVSYTQLDVYKRQSSNRADASAFASSVLPTPVGPRNMKEPMGLVGSLIPAFDRMIASVTFSTPLSLIHIWEQGLVLETLGAERCV